MCGKMLAYIEEQIKFEPQDMCDSLELRRRTYQNYKADKRSIPAELATRIRELYKRDREFMAGIGDRVDAAAKEGKK